MSKERLDQVYEKLEGKGWAVRSLSDSIYAVSDQEIQWEISRGMKTYILRFVIMGELGRVSSNINDVFYAELVGQRKKLFFSKINSANWKKDQKEFLDGLEQELDPIRDELRLANEKMLALFKSRLADNKELEFFKYCFPHFSVDVRKEQYVFHVEILLEIELKDNEFWEETSHGKRLITIDETTGEQMVVIGNSHQGKSVFRAVMGFGDNEVEVINDWDIKIVEELQKLGTLKVNEDVI